MSASIQTQNDRRAGSTATLRLPVRIRPAMAWTHISVPNDRRKNIRHTGIQTP